MTAPSPNHRLPSQRRHYCIPYTRMEDSRVPQELIDTVIDNLHKDHHGLLACSLVCRSWLPSSQRHLFRRVTFTLDGNGCKGLQALLCFPRLADYIRELKVHVSPDLWSVYRAHLGTEQSLPMVLLKLSKLQTIKLHNLDLDNLPVDLPQSLRWVLLLPSLTSLTLGINHYESISFESVECHAECLMSLSRTYVILLSWQFQDLLTPGDDEPWERGYLSHLNLEFFQGYCGLHLDWSIGPRSPFEISHIQYLRVDFLSDEDEKALNLLLRTIGSSLKQVEFCVTVPREFSPRE
jgi:hypothetical protein